jgi:hypothetical protein
LENSKIYIKPRKTSGSPWEYKKISKNLEIYGQRLQIVEMQKSAVSPLVQNLLELFGNTPNKLEHFSRF